MKITIVKHAAAPGAEKIRPLVENGTFAGKIVLQQQGKRIYAFVDDVNPGQCIGRVQGDDDELAQIVTGPHRIKMLGILPGAAKLTFQCEVEALGDTVVVSNASSSVVDDAMARAVSRGAATQDEVDWAKMVMNVNRVPAELQAANFDSWTARPGVEKLSTFYRDIREEGQESFLTTALISATVQGALILRGGKSVGKNVFAHTFAAVRHQPIYILNFNDRMTLAQVFGESTVDNTALDAITPEMAAAYLRVQEGHPSGNDRQLAAQFELLKTQASAVQIRHVESTVIKWAKYGGVLLLDEVNMAEPNLLQQLVNPLADGSRLLMVPGEDPIRIHEDCFLMGGMNPPTYDGTYALNDATASRLGVLEFDMGGTIIPALKANFKPEDLPDVWGDQEAKNRKWAELLERCDRFFNRCKVEVDANGTSDQVLNIRGFVVAIRSYLRFPTCTTISRQLKTYVVNTCQDPDERAIFTQKLTDTFG